MVVTVDQDCLPQDAGSDMRSQSAEVKPAQNGRTDVSDAGGGKPMSDPAASAAPVVRAVRNAATDLESTHRLEPPSWRCLIRGVSSS